MQRDGVICLRLPGPILTLCLALALAGCGVGRGFSGSGDGFGGFGLRPLPVPEAEAEGYTIRRLRGEPDNTVALQADPSIRWPFTAEDRRTSVFETEEEQRQRLERDRQQRQRQTRGSSTGTREAARPPEQIPTAPPPRAPAPAPEVDQRGQPIPFAPPGTVVTGGAPGSRTGTFGGPAGTGTIVRDGGTNTLMGADGTIRTVPATR